MWTNYRKTFPARYIKSGYFDQYIQRVISEKKPKTILDIGGGPQGTETLKGSGGRVYLLDPFIPHKPRWIYKKVGWDAKEKFDAIVCRGSINYLTKGELLKIKGFLKIRGFFIANSFLNPPPETWTERQYQTISDRIGIERFRYNRKKIVIEHELIPDRGGIIKHSFFYYSLSDYKKIFPGLKLMNYKNNSIILYFEK